MMPANERLFLVDLGYCCFGMVSVAGTVVMAAPIAKWMRGKTLAEVKPWLLAKKAHVTECFPVPTAL
ncbi:hypothetical protein [Spirosoma sp. 209]|uniref:hypothetical protein n=1 Tax=Spirosoma sp. 209 TaxID=1955701 RepID=UPI00098CF7B7|nr:hypothetical protein [Spirosoma sp. 209]